MTNFNFEILKETEKAVFARVPYFEATHEGIKSHKQLFYDCWIPKAVIEKGTAKHFVISKRNEVRLTNPHQKRCSMPLSWNTLGEYAPVKTAVVREEIDREKLAELVSSFEAKYEVSLIRLIIDGAGKHLELTPEDEKIVNHLEYPSLAKPFTPRKLVTYYR